MFMWFKKNQLETPFIGDNVKALIKTSNCENLVLYFSEKVQKIAAFATGPRSTVGNVSGYRCMSDCNSRGREFDPGPVPYFRGD